MTFIYLFYLSKIIYLNTFLEFLSFIYVTSKLSILFNQTKHSVGLAPYYILLFFIIIFQLSLLKFFWYT